jgi:hypothetical protein
MPVLLWFWSPFGLDTGSWQGQPRFFIAPGMKYSYDPTHTFGEFA